MAFIFNFSSQPKFINELNTNIKQSFNSKDISERAKEANVSEIEVLTHVVKEFNRNQDSNFSLTSQIDQTNKVFSAQLTAQKNIMPPALRGSLTKRYDLNVLVLNKLSEFLKGNLSLIEKLVNLKKEDPEKFNKIINELKKNADTQQLVPILENLSNVDTTSIKEIKEKETPSTTTVVSGTANLANSKAKGFLSNLKSLKEPQVPDVFEDQNYPL